MTVAPDADSVPIDGTPLLIAGAKASVPASQLPQLLSRTQAALAGRLAEYRRSYERVYRDEGREVFLVSSNHWESIGDELGFGRREIDAIRRAHHEQLKRLGSERDRREEFETALEIRDAVVVGVPDEAPDE